MFLKWYLLIRSPEESFRVLLSGYNLSEFQVL